MNVLIPVVAGVVVLGGIAAVAMADSGSDTREIWLIKGKSYYITHQITGPGWDASMYPGFCNFSQPAASGANTPADPMVVTFTAQWCAENTLFVVPENMAILETE